MDHTKELLPVNMRGQEDLFKELGFYFEPSPNDDVLCHAILPIGWTRERCERYWSYILDEKGRKRVLCFYKAESYDRNAHMLLLHRYKFKETRLGGALMMPEMRVHVTDHDGEVVHEAGIFIGYGEERDEFYKNLYKWMDMNYPDYKNPLAYW